MNTVITPYSLLNQNFLSTEYLYIEREESNESNGEANKFWQNKIKFYYIYLKYFKLLGIN